MLSVHINTAVVSVTQAVCLQPHGSDECHSGCLSTSTLQLRVSLRLSVHINMPVESVTQAVYINTAVKSVTQTVCPHQHGS